MQAFKLESLEFILIFRQSDNFSCTFIVDGQFPHLFAVRLRSVILNPTDFMCPDLMLKIVYLFLFL